MSELKFQLTAKNVNYKESFHLNNYILVHTCGVYASGTVDFYRPEGTSDYMLNYISEGEISYNCDNGPSKQMRTDKNYIIIYRPGEPQYLFDASPNLCRYWIHFGGSGIPELLKSCELDKERFYKVSGEKLDDIFLKIIQAIQTPSLFKELECTTYLLALLLEITKQNKKYFDKNASKEDRLLPALKILNLNYRSQLDVDDLAKACQISKYHFIRYFKQHTGISPYAYLINVRMDYAKNLLTSTEEKIGTISEMVGYNDRLYFSKVFKGICGVTPSEFRQNNSTTGRSLLHNPPQ